MSVFESDVRVFHGLANDSYTICYNWIGHLLFKHICSLAISLQGKMPYETWHKLTSGLIKIAKLAQNRSYQFH